VSCAVADRHALLLSGSIGMGHDVVAEACAASLQQRQWTTQILDSIRLMGERSGGLGERTFRAMLATPGLYDAFHFHQLRQGGRLAERADRASAHYLVPALEAQLSREPARLLISVFATGAGAASRVKVRYPGLVTAVFCTDVDPHRLWVHGNTDLYLVTSVTARAFVRRFHPEAEVAIVPTPVRAPFYSAPDQAAARAELNVPADARCVLLMGGAWGLGPLLRCATSLAASGIYTLAVAGRNPRLEAALRAAAAETAGRLVPFGYTDAVATLMAASDLVITTSGDTCAEARVGGRRLMLLDAVPGPGRENLQHELERGNADVAPADPAGLVRAVSAALDREPAAVDRGDATPAAWEQAFGAALARVGLDAPAGPQLDVRAG
jgi:UDP-N-acetylglucosamine:LPS N-acetylglucosamine transferase